MTAHVLDIRLPILNSYQRGGELFAKSNGSDIARIVFKKEGATFLSPVDHLMVGMREDREKTVYSLVKSGKVKILKVPGLVDVVPKGADSYYESARHFMTHINEEMYKLNNLQSKR